MSDYKPIDVGDRVDVTFVPDRDGDPLSITGTVKHRPQNTGDCWCILEDDGILRNVMMFEMMTRIK